MKEKIGGEKMKVRQIDPVVKELIDKIQKNKGLGGIPLKELLEPREGYAKKIAENFNLTRVQLRKIFAEFKTIYTNYIKGDEKTKEKMRNQLYKLYPIVQYQTSRNKIEEGFKNLIFTILDTLDSNFTKENFERTIDFMEALVAYIKKD